MLIDIERRQYRVPVGWAADPHERLADLLGLGVHTGILDAELPHDLGTAPLAVEVAGVIEMLREVLALLLQAGLVPESAAPCQQGVSCTEAQIQILGFVSIPMLSLLVFASVAGLLSLLKRRQSP